MDKRVTALRIYRTAAGLSQCELAGIVGTYQVHYSRIERGVTPPLPGEKQALAAALGVSVEVLFGGSK